MSKTTRKRLRKPKKKPRDGIAEDDVDLQNPVVKVLKINTESTRETDEIDLKPLPVKHNPILKDLQINTKRNEEPEACNKDILKKLGPTVMDNTGPESSIKFSLDVQVKSDAEETKNVTKEATEPASIFCLKPVPKYVVSNTLPVDVPPKVQKLETQILEAANQIKATLTNPADKILDIGVRNSIGHGRTVSVCTNIHDKKIQEILDAWRIWKSRRLLRGCPLFYKCYLCKKAWFNLSEFRDHINEHPVVNIGLENYQTNETNIVAYTGKRIIYEIIAEGYCNLCGQDYNAHQVNNRYLRKYYRNNLCTKNFPTCISLKNHMLTCTQCKDEKPFQCQICKSTFDTDKNLETHLRLCHIVRSDIPIVTGYNTCKKCSSRNIVPYLHVCSKRVPHVECNYCFCSFQNKFLRAIHIENSSERVICEICGKVMLYKCMIYEHMMEHSNNYVLVWKCVICEDLKLFLAIEAAKQHLILEHYEQCQEQQYLVQIIVPKACIGVFIPVPRSDPKTVPGRTPVKKEPGSQSKTITVTDDNTEPVSGTNMVRESETSLEAGPKSDTNIIIKEEPLDIDENPLQIAIKEKMYDNDTNPSQVTTSHENSDNLMLNIQVKQENDEDDVIKLDISNNFLVQKQKVLDDSQLEDTFEYQTCDNPVNIKEEAVSNSEVLQQRKIHTCQRCGFEGEHREYRAHVEFNCSQRSALDKIFYCTKCNKSYLSLRRYVGHLILHGYETLSCPECLKKFSSFNNLLPHIQNHIRDTFLLVKSITQDAKTKPERMCKKCNKVVLVSEFFEHWELHIQSSPETVAVKLEKKTQCNSLQDAHTDIIKENLICLQGNTRECKQCQRTYRSTAECKLHVIVHLLDDAYKNKQTYGELRCQKCGVGFGNQELYKEHMRDHASLPVYRCKICDRTFRDGSCLNKHKFMHNFKVYISDLCYKKFRSKSSLEKHIAIHAKTKPITCHSCGKISYCESSHRLHRRNVHEKYMMGYRCVICKERFLSEKLKWDHLWEVHKERKKKADCPICFESFRKYTDVKAHAKKEHHTSISVYNVKKGLEKPKITEIQKRLENRTSFEIGEVETLVVY